MKKVYGLVLLLLSIPMSAFGQDGDSVWENFGFGLGISYTMDTGDNDRVKEAIVVDGIVRVTDKENGVPRLVLEGHYFFDYDGKFGHGPFVAIQPGDEDIINAVALGYMIGFRENNKSDYSWNLGVGFAADPNVQILGDGIKENEALPGNETEIRYKEETQYGVMLIFSTSW